MNNKTIKTIYKITLIVVLVSSVVLTLFFAYRVYVVKRVYPLKYTEEIIYVSKTIDVDPFLVASIINVESSFDKNAISIKNAKGLMQLKEETANYVAKKYNIKSYNLFDASDNLMLGCLYFKMLKNRFIDIDTALSAYNAGEGKVMGWLTEKTYSKDGFTLDYIPYKETREYVKKVNKSFLNYKKLYKNILDK